MQISGCRISLRFDDDEHWVTRRHDVEPVHGEVGVSVKPVGALPVLDVLEDNKDLLDTGTREVLATSRTTKGEGVTCSRRAIIWN